MTDILSHALASAGYFLQVVGVIAIALHFADVRSVLGLPSFWQVGREKGAHILRDAFGAAGDGIRRLLRRPPPQPHTTVPLAAATQSLSSTAADVRAPRRGSTLEEQVKGLWSAVDVLERDMAARLVEIQREASARTQADVELAGALHGKVDELRQTLVAATTRHHGRRLAWEVGAVLAGIVLAALSSWL